MLISIVNFSTISDEDVLRAVRAVNTQLHGDFAPYWHMTATLRLEGHGGKRPPQNVKDDVHADLRGDAIIYLWDDIPPDQALGYHDQTNAGLPYGFVFTELSRSMGESWSVTLSHEALELIGDATANVFAAGPHPAERERTVFHWYEMCDAVQAEQYAIDGVLVSNFVLPAYFTPDNEAGARNDFLGRLRADGTALPSFGINPGGYVGFFDPTVGGHQTFALAGDEKAQQRLTTKGRYGSARRAQRYRKLGVDRGADLGRRIERVEPAISVVVPVVSAPAASLPAAAAPLPSAAPPVAIAAAPGPVPGAQAQSDLPALDEDGLRDLERQLDADPEGTLRGVKQVLAVVARDWDVPRLRRYIQIARTGEEDPLRGANVKRAAITLGLPGSRNLPTGFSFEGMTPDIPIEVTNCRFEEDRDAWGWVKNAGWAFLEGKLNRIVRAKWRAPTECFDDPVDASGMTTIALVSDFGTGLYHSKYIARHIRSYRPRYAFHLGDVYYAGKQSEFTERFTDVLKPLLDDGIELFALNANHEMLSGGTWYYDYLDAKQRIYGPSRQRQLSSVFAVQVGRFRFVGIDSDYLEEGRLVQETLPWIKGQLERRSADQINILLSSNEPFTLGSKALTELYRTDLQSVVDKVDLWFWGNTHYCAVYNRRDQAAGPDRPPLPFIGSCIGHGGYPYDVVTDVDKQKAASVGEVDFVEDRTRFWGTNVRPDRGNNGFVMMRLDHKNGAIHLDYIDWRKNRRITYLLSKGAGGPLRIVERTPGG
jgi:hypothetical protein